MDTAGQLVFVRDLHTLHETRQQHAQAVNAGEEERVARGAYFPTGTWTQLDARQRYLVRVRAIAETRRHRPVLSHWSAAAFHGLPTIGDWPTQVHTIIGSTNGGRSRNGVIKHSLRLDDTDVMEIDGVLVTTVARTVLDIAVSGSFMASVTMADRALHLDRFAQKPPLTTREELCDVWERRLSFRGSARTLEVIDFAETLADSPLESISRVNMQVIGCPRPKLQSRFYDYQGFIGETDFEWPDLRLLGEADGDIKYLDPAYRAGRTADQVVRDEKVREDRLRALGHNVSRWPWSVGFHPAALRNHLAAAGLPMGLRWASRP
jgi:hypothetical protein